MTDHEQAVKRRETAPGRPGDPQAAMQSAEQSDARGLDEGDPARVSVSVWRDTAVHEASGIRDLAGKVRATR